MDPAFHFSVLVESHLLLRCVSSHLVTFTCATSAFTSAQHTSSSETAQHGAKALLTQEVELITIRSTPAIAAVKGSVSRRSSSLPLRISVLPRALERPSANVNLSQSLLLNQCRTVHQSCARSSVFSRLVSFLRRNHPRLSEKQAHKTAGATASTNMSSEQEQAISPIPPPPATMKLDGSRGPLVWIDCEYVSTCPFGSMITKSMLTFLPVVTAYRQNDGTGYREG